MSDEQEESGGDIPFKIEWRGEFALRRAVGVFLIDLIVTDETGFIQPAATVGASEPFFDEGAEQATTWAEKTVKAFGETYRQAMIDALGSLLAGASQMALVEMGVSPLDKNSILRDQMFFAEKVLRHRLGLKAGRAPWIPSQLQISVFQAMTKVPKGEPITYDAVAEHLRSAHPDRAPHSGEALRKMLKELGVPWKQLKGRATKVRKNGAQKRRNGNEEGKDKNGETEIFH